MSPFAYLERGRYIDYLGPWLSRFGADVTVLFLEDMVGATRPRSATCTPGSVSTPASGLPRWASRSTRASSAGPELARGLLGPAAGLLPRERPGAGRLARPPAAVAVDADTARRTENRVTEPEIAFNRASVEGAELEYIAAVARERAHVVVGALLQARRRDHPARRSGAEDVLLTTSCTAALEMCALLLDLEPGDTVIVPSFTFTSHGARVRPRGRADPLLRHRARDARPRPASTSPSCSTTPCERSSPCTTRGVACDMDGIREVLAGPPDVAIIEDNAHGLFGRSAASRSAASAASPTLSFHETKNFICGEGGALIVNDERGRRPRPGRSTTRAPTARRSSWARSTSTPGRTSAPRSGCRDVLAAYLYGQLEQRDVIQAQARRPSSTTTTRRLAPYAEELGSGCRSSPPDREPAYHMFYVLAPRHATRDAVLGDARAGHAADVPLRAAARLGRGPSSSRPGRPSARSPTTSAAACCGCRSTTT